MRTRTLLAQVLVANLLLIVLATGSAILLVNSDVEFAEGAAGILLAFAVALTVLVNFILISRRFEPLEQLVDEMERADLSKPGANLRGADGRPASEEVERLQRSFHRMLERLESERRRASSAALEAQERERARVARDLHDEVNQSLTALLLRLEAARADAPPELAAELSETKALANRAMGELLVLARQLRPTALDDLGLEAALAELVAEIGIQTPIDTTLEARGDFADLPEEMQLVLYRVAQEALSNAVRHSGARRIDVRLLCQGDGVELSVADDGTGFSFEDAHEGLGISGMRERALLVGAELRFESPPRLGTRVLLRVPAKPHA